ncbi:MAG: hypothetical protein H6818_02315 [Phycisphaerales bacterium]|nr:hypothetical protein [Phycisphaerales bacterium]MCB9863148.1 hypothetical protein [Phycisphaerales bacterium]
MNGRTGKAARLSALSILFILLGTLAVSMGGCELSCNSDDASDGVRDVVDEIGDEAEDVVKEIKDKD